MALILTETRGRVGVVTLNRREALNALNATMVGEIGNAVAAFDADDGIGAILAAVYFEKHAGALERIAAARKPIVAAVAGFALGGGCELALLADIVVAADTAKFGQPEITLGIIPGMGGTQRLPRAVGKAKAMDMILTGRMMDATEAERAGLVSRVVPAADLLTTALAIATKIAAFSLPSVMKAKEAVALAVELPLAEGIRAEQRLFHALFATEDQKEGMAAFAAKRPPVFRNR